MTFEGHAPFRGGRSWYRVSGGVGTVPVIVIHGGPGAGHEYVAVHQRLANRRTIVLYDQIGCGRSACDLAAGDITIETFVAELNNLRQHLGFERVALVGHSWGGFVALQYALAFPQHVAGLVLASTSASIDDVIACQQAQLDALPPDIRKPMLRAEAEGDLAHRDYRKGLTEYYRRHVCRLSPWPESMLIAGQNQAGSPVYSVMSGPNEFTITGKLLGWSQRAALHQIKTSTLITAGRFDQCSPRCWESLHQGIAGSHLHVFDHSAHVPHHEEPALYFELLDDFLSKF
jgi:proline-specific peptidase